MTTDQTPNSELMAQVAQLRQEVADLRAARNTKRRLPRLLSRSGLVVGISLLSVLVLSGAAFASIPGPSGAINGCYDRGGALSIIDSAATCPGKTTALTWNQAGVQGPRGIQGIQGPQGPAGPTNPLFCPHCDLTAATLPTDSSGAYFPAARFTQGNLTNANLAFADLEGASLDLATLTNISLYHAHLAGGILVLSDLTGADLVGADLSGADLSRSNLTNADLSTATGLTISTVVLATWSNTTCPDGSNSNNDGNTCVGHGIS